MFLLPLWRHRLEAVPSVLVQDQRPIRQSAELVERSSQVVDVVEREAGHDAVEPAALVECLDRRPAEDRALRRLRVDGNDVVAALGQRPRQLPLSAADFE